MSDLKNIPNSWELAEFEEVLNYIQPTDFIVKNTDYNDSYKTPVLTPGKTFIKGYTNEVEGIFNSLPCIIFDDFTTASRFVKFPFKVKSSAMKILVPFSDLVNLKFAFYAMQLTKVRSDTHKRYWISVFAKQKFPLPPFKEQNRIIDKIEELFSELDNGITNLKLAQSQLKVYRQSLLKAAFEGKLTEEWRKENNPEPAEKLLERIKEERSARYEREIAEWKATVKEWEKEGKKGRKPGKPRKLELFDSLDEELVESLATLPSNWKWINLGDVTELVSGQHILAKDYNELGKGIPYLTGPSDFGLKYPTVTKWTTAPKAFASAGDILITVKGSGVGKVNRMKDHGAISRQLMALTPMIDTEFLHYRLISQFAIFQELSTGTAIPGLGRDQILRHPIPLCSTPEQEEIANVLELQFSIIDNMGSTIEKELKKTELNRQSILKKAFEGKLVAQDSKDEPASVLLERIKEEKTKYLTEQKKRKKKSPKKTRKMSKNLSVEDILKAAKKPLPAKVVWQQSKHKDDIEAFYAELKKIQDRVKEDKKGTESLLSLA